MKNIFRNLSLVKVEFYAATTIFCFAVLALFVDFMDNKKVVSPFSYYYVSVLVKLCMIYLVFLLLNFIIVPRIVKRDAVWINLFVAVFAFVAMALAFGVIDTMEYYGLVGEPGERDYGHTPFWYNFNLTFACMVMFTGYSLLRYAARFTFSGYMKIQPRYRLMVRDSVIGLVSWLVSILLLLAGEAEGEVIVGWGLIFPLGIIFYCYSLYSLIPRSLKKKRPVRAYVWRASLVLILGFGPVLLIALLFINNGEFAAIVSVLNTLFQLIVTVPLSWMLYKRHAKGNEEVFALKRKLRQSDANLDFLRSQINPHFLFNALNTIYGTAIQENAERTSEGIERLGAMMRFMLRENMQEKIPLERDIEYLNNYISLQRLRTDSSPAVIIQAEIAQPPANLQIAPMLLIPFVENAFKHGISLREPSYIRIALEIRDKHLFFSVHNSKHQKLQNDPEREHSGIGLNNVQQRLKLLYPGKHELVKNETTKEFFIHLTIELS